MTFRTASNTTIPLIRGDSSRSCFLLFRLLLEAEPEKPSDDECFFLSGTVVLKGPVLTSVVLLIELPAILANLECCTRLSTAA